MKISNYTKNGELEKYGNIECVVEKMIKRGNLYRCIFYRKENSLHVYDEEEQVDYEIGNFYLRLKKIDISDKIDNCQKIKYWFDIYRYNNRKNIKEDVQFYYNEGEKVIRKMKERLTINCILNILSLKYFDIYIHELINQGVIKKRYKSVNNEENIELVRKYLISFVKLIYDNENKFIECNFDFTEENKEYYNSNRICGNKDLFLKQRKFDEMYTKIGYMKESVITGKSLYYFIHLPSLIKLMENENRFPQRVSAQVLNIGLRELGILALPTGRNVCNYKTTDGKISMNLTKLYAEKLIELAYPEKLITIDEEQEENNCSTFKTGAGFEVSCENK